MPPRPSWSKDSRSTTRGGRPSNSRGLTARGLDPMLPARRPEATVNVGHDGGADAARRTGRTATAAEDWVRIREILRAALERDPGERPEFLDEACGADAALRQSVDALLSAHE